MQRTLLVLILMVATLVAASGVAVAVLRVGGPGDDTLIGFGKLCGHALTRLTAVMHRRLDVCTQERRG